MYFTQCVKWKDWFRTLYTHVMHLTEHTKGNMKNASGHSDSIQKIGFLYQKMDIRFGK